MLRRITVASSKSSLITPQTVASARPLLFTASMRPMHTTGPLNYALDSDAEEQRARRRQQLEEEIKSGKLPEVNREEEFRPESIIKRARETITSQDTDLQTNAKKEDLPRASQKHNVEPKGASDDFAEENSGISDAQMSPDKQLHVHDAPPMQRGGSDEGSIISDAIGGNEDGSVGSKLRGKMNASEHQQKFTARGNLNGMDRNNRNTSTSKSGEKMSREGLSDIERSFSTEQLSSDLSGTSEEGKNQEWSSASSSTNTSWIADNQQAFSTYADPKSEKRQERFSTRAPRPDASTTSSFPRNGFQKRSYATDSNKKEAIIGDSPIPASSVSESSSKSFSASSNTTGSSKRWPIDTNIEIADFVGEKRMSDDDKGTQAKRNEARFGKGWQNRVRDSDSDFASSGAAGAPARSVRDKPVNYKRSYSTTPRSRYTNTTSQVVVNNNVDYSTDVNALKEMVQPQMTWRVTSAQGTGAWHL